jgi:putative transcriptional regulator
VAERDIGLEILTGLQEIKAHKTGDITLKVRTWQEPEPTQAIRAKLKLSQAVFAALIGVSVRTIQDWEQGRRQPSGPAKSLLRIAAQHPEVFIELA